ncbi:CLUMA_CG002339, isoform A [Clunio marinus]|uniref:CLUMA_CG002339, isoform A n=1 Tax=Clunio marinus TaxID=568069 RepID=A0A1J1HPZ5_9DIPT|nr:CLUMA_CG002339, isoform A [Clunio marinus]
MACDPFSIYSQIESNPHGSLNGSKACLPVCICHSNALAFPVKVSVRKRQKYVELHRFKKHE